LGVIYKITNQVNGKIYVGQTSQTIVRRWRRHIEHAASGRKCAFHNAIRKYGPEAFSKQILEECDPSALNEREIYWIAELKAIQHDIGYNRTTGGQKGGKMSPEVVARLSAMRKGSGNPRFGKSPSPEHRASLSRAHKGRIAPNKGKPGKPHTAETKAIIGNKARGRKSPFKGVRRPENSHPHTISTKLKIGEASRKFRYWAKLRDQVQGNPEIWVPIHCKEHLGAYEFSEQTCGIYAVRRINQDEQCLKDTKCLRAEFCFDPLCEGYRT